MIGSGIHLVLFVRFHCITLDCFRLVFECPSTTAKHWIGLEIQISCLPTSTMEPLDVTRQLACSWDRRTPTFQCS